MAKAIHSMVRVLDMERSIDFYDKAFALKPADIFDFDDFRWPICATTKSISSSN